MYPKNYEEIYENLLYVFLIENSILFQEIS